MPFDDLEEELSALGYDAARLGYVSRDGYRFGGRKRKNELWRAREARRKPKENKPSATALRREADRRWMRGILNDLPDDEETKPKMKSTAHYHRMLAKHDLGQKAQLVAIGRALYAENGRPDVDRIFFANDPDGKEARIDFWYWLAWNAWSAYSIGKMFGVSPRSVARALDSRGLAPECSWRQPRDHVPSEARTEAVGRRR